MPVKPVPDGYHTVTPYIVVEDAGGLIEFMTKAFGGTERVRVDGESGAIMHAEVEIGDSVVMVASAGANHDTRNAMLHLYVPDIDPMYQRAVEAGGNSLRAPIDQPYGDRSAGVKDNWGNDPKP